MRLATAFLVLAAVASAQAASTKPAVPQAELDRRNKAVAEALASSNDPLMQARALCRLAWPTSGARDEGIATRARWELEHFGSRYMFALQEAINEAPAIYSDEIVKALIAQDVSLTNGKAPEFVPTLIDALWVGNEAAKKRAIDALLADRPPLAVQPMIDVAIDHPALAGDVVRALGLMRYEQARFWLEKMMLQGPPELRAAAASSLAQIGAAALGPLKTALKAPSKDVRLLAARSLLPAATDLELGALYEYVEKHGDDDPALTKSIKASAANIEKAIAARDAAEAAAAPKDF